MSTFTRFFDLPRELRYMVYEQCDDEFVVATDSSGLVKRRFHFSDTLRKLGASNKTVRNEILESMGPIRTLAVVTELKNLLESSLVATDQSEMVMPHTIQILCIPTKNPNRSSDLTIDWVKGTMNRHISSISGGKGSPLTLSTVALDDRLRLLEVDVPVAAWYGSSADFRIRVHHAKSILRAQQADCTLFVDSNEGDSFHLGLTSASRLVFQGNGIPDLFTPSDISAVDHTFLLDITDHAGRTNCDSTLVVKSLIEHVWKLCKEQHYMMSRFADDGKASRVAVHLTVKPENVGATQILERCRNLLEGLGDSTPPERSRHKLEVKVGGTHPVAPAGYRVMIQDTE